MRKSDQATKVRSYIKANPKAKPSAVAKACGVSVQYVYGLKYHDKRKRKLARKIAPAKNLINKTESKTTKAFNDKYRTAMESLVMESLVEQLRDMIRERDAVIAYLENKLEMNK